MAGKNGIIAVNSKKILFLCILSYSCAAFSVAQDSSVPINKIDFEIGGIKLGDTLTESFSKQHCQYSLKDNEEVECKRIINFHSIKLSILYFFYDEKLLAISIKYPSSNYNDLIKIYTKKFSQSPHNEKAEPIFLREGDSHVNMKTSWNTTSGKFVIEKYGNSFQKGIAYLSSEDYGKYKTKKKEEINPGVMRKLFGDIFD
jgi:hypothetical protein